MANPPKAKGTGGETELLRLLPDGSARTSPGFTYDIVVPGGSDTSFQVNVLATRPDYGRWLVTLDLEDFLDMRESANQEYAWAPALRVEVKRYKRFAHHAIFESKFPRKLREAP